MSKPGPKPRPLDERLLAHRSVTNSGCWEWTGARTRGGYGHLKMAGHFVRVARLSLKVFRGIELGEGEQALHSCDNPPCFNPDHLRPGTHRDNIKDAVDRRRYPRGLAHYRVRRALEAIL